MLAKILIAILGVVLIWFLAGPKAARFLAILFPGLRVIFLG